MKKYYIKPLINNLRIVEDIHLLSTSTSPSKQDVIDFTPDVIPDADDGVVAS